ncbi:hydroxysteroid dehydrogenase-like protein 2 [Ornithodoros turicata]|uniref:hydroxysteroid dehydrogenase-like protein 2 n=1 Tax=Ornithodoros turicata TaxID=34597 RepID=UPI003139BB40
MINTGKLAGRTLFITGATRGIGKEIALKAAKDGANVVIAAKTAEPHPKLPGTIYTAAQEVEAAGGKCLACIVDVRNEEQVKKAVGDAVSKFGGIDVLVNNASAISLTGILDTEMKRYDLMHSVNVRGTFLTSKYCIPHLKKSSNPHILMLSPPLLMKPMWFQNHLAYTMSKYGMSMCVLGLAEELRSDGIAVNALWPKTAIHTAAIEMLMGEEGAVSSRKPSILADAAYAIFSKPSGSFTGNFLIDEKFLQQEGVTDFEQYACVPGSKLKPDFFIPDECLREFDEGSGIAAPMAGASALDGIITKIGSKLNEELVSKTQGLFHFQVKGGEDFFVDMKNGAGSVGKGPPSQPADVTFSMDGESLVKMFTGGLKPTAAFMSGKMKIQGDMGKAMKLEKLMAQLRSKL